MSASIFLKIEGVEGDSVKEGHDGEIDVISWSWDMSQEGLAHIGKGAGGGKVSVGDVQIAKRIDQASPSLMMKCCKGEHIPSAKLVVERAGGDKPLPYMEMEMKKVFVTMISPSISDSDTEGHEMISLNFESYEIKVTAQTESGGSGATATAGFNIAVGKAM